jgi:hypothetical protein
MANKIEKQILLGKIKGDIRNVNFLKIITEQAETIRNLERMAGGKPDKVEQAYFQKQNARLKELQDIVKNWICEAFEDDTKVYEKTMSFGNILKNYEIEVIVKRKHNN